MPDSPVKKVIADLQFEGKRVENVISLPQRTAVCTGPSSTANGRGTCGYHADSTVKNGSHVAQTLQHLHKIIG
jgi:hypothetical protein